ncbi:MAG: type IV secretory system conjugative DNA transfer family protein, partial [Clostridiales bacterium]|nr:type IV secretory system conjugative DNA transfer family protein [Candidatus Apopatousia equi]
CITFYIIKGQKIFVFDFQYLTELSTLGIAAGVIAIVLFAKFAKFDIDNPSSKGQKNKVVDDQGREVKQYYSTRWVSLQELRTNPKYMFNTYSNLKNQNKDGIPIRAEHIHGKTEVNMVKPIHTIVIGTTGSGKTTMFVDPTIQMLSETKSKPSLVISDPKGELYAHNAEKLKKSGYDVQVVDLREPDKSARWNPIERAYDAYQRAHHLTDEVKKHTGNPKSINLLTIPNADYSQFWYEFDGVAYDSLDILKKDMAAMKDKLENIAMEDIQDIAEVLCPIVGQDPSWPRGAQGFIRAIMIAMLEDSLIPELGMTKEKFNFYNVYKIAGIRDNGNDNFVTLRNYFAGRPKTSPTGDLANTVVNNAGSTAKGYMGHVTGSLNVFADSGVCYLTSGTDIKFNEFADKPSALFIIIPDEKNTRHAIANIYISQLYKTLIERANAHAKQTGGEPELPRNVYFLLDEFGNLPKFEKMKSFITAGRSRKIFLTLVLQDYTQLASIYGEQDAATIRNNCNIHIFIGTKDAKTREEFSKNCGNIQINITSKQTSTSSNKHNAEDGSTSTSTSSQIQQRPLISADELDHLEPNTVVVNMFGDFSLKSVFTPSYKNPDYDFTRQPIMYKPSKYLDQESVLYDIVERNKKILKDDDDGDDDDFDFSKFGRR